jgi:hypothetical protein
MNPLLAYLLSHLIFYGDIVGDPIHASWKGRDELRSMECERLTHPEAFERFPGQLPAPGARSRVIVEVDALACSHKWIEPGSRNARDELILEDLSQEMSEIVGLAQQQADAGTAWFVDAYYPDPVMVRKIATAARMSFAERGISVYDQAPLMSAGDVEVLRTLQMRDSIPHACRRMFQRGELEDQTNTEKRAFLAIALVHEKESQLHAGVCQQGEFRWLR